MLLPSEVRTILAAGARDCCAEALVWPMSLPEPLGLVCVALLPGVVRAAPTVVESGTEAMPGLLAGHCLVGEARTQLPFLSAM